MAQPSTRQELIDYCLRQLGAPVLEINVADEQIQDLVDDAVQYFQERHFDGVIQTYLKYKVTQADIDRGKARPTTGTGITTETATTTIVGTATTFSYYENSNYLQVPPDIIGINKVFQYDDAQSVSSSNMFSFKYQLFLNDIYYWGTTDLLSYSMAMSYLETMNFLLNTHKQIRFNQRQDRMYLDVDWSNLRAGQYLIIDCWRSMDPSDYSRVWNDSFLKPYLTALIKRQWGQNLIKFQGVKLPGGIEFNGRQLYDDAQLELDRIKEKMSNTYELPPLDMIG
jgi:type IV secretory pathway VirB3-like protein